MEAGQDGGAAGSFDERYLLATPPPPPPSPPPPPPPPSPPPSPPPPPPPPPPPSPPARVSLPFSFPDLYAEFRRMKKPFFQVASTGFSIPVMLTWRGCVKMAMRRCPLWKRRWPAISPWARHPLLRLPPCHLSPFSKHLA